MTPNLFDYATHELSQDAFLCWLMAWADRRCASADPALQAAAELFVRRLLGAGGREAPAEGFSVEVHRQRRHMDVFVLVGQGLAILIEDKTHTTDGLAKLERTRGVAGRESGSRKLVAVYLKTGDQCDFNVAVQAGYVPFTRPDLIEVLRQGMALGVRNSIYLEFLGHMIGRESDVQAFWTQPPEKCRRPGEAWKGLYAALQPEFPGSRWHYVANPQGGFMAFHWVWRKILGGRIYVQLEECMVCVKIEVPDKSRQSEQRADWSERVIRAGQGRGLSVVRPTTFGKGTWMTVAVVEGEYRIYGAERLDLAATVAGLRQIGTLVEELAKGEAPAAVGGADDGVVEG